MRNFGVFIGRFQPFHNAHLKAVRFALSEVKNLIIVMGSDCQARTIKNPWTSAERDEMILASVTRDEWERIRIVRAKDYLYNDNLWLVSVQQKIEEHTQAWAPCDDVVLFGHEKDRSSFYLKLFPQWKFESLPEFEGGLDATHIRNLHFTCDLIGIQPLVPEGTFGILQHSQSRPEFRLLNDEYHHLVDYRKKWEGAPFPPTFVTTDAIVIKSGHVLVVRRGGKVGKDQLALPGGFLDQHETLVDGMLRELKEETAIRVNKAELRKAIVDQKVFDHPSRSLRGRTITHAYCIDLGYGSLPKVKGGDDAAKAFWLPLRDLDEDQFFEDHFHIIQNFVSRF